MNNFLSKLKPESKVTVGVSVSPNVGLEMMMVDASQHKVMKYAFRPMSYNPSTREIEDYGEFKTLLNELFKELNIDPKSANVVLNMPNVCFGHTYLPTVLDDEGVTTALVSELEENYLFKKNTPVVAWSEVKLNNSTDKRYVLYTGIQEPVLDIIKQIFEEIGATLIAVENSFSSMLKALEYTNLVHDFASSHESWNILLVTQNSFVVFNLIGYNIIEYYEDPLAIKSFNNDEVYSAIAQSSMPILDRFASDNLLVISESNDVSAEILSMQLKRMGSVLFLESNQYAKQSVIDVDFSVLPHYVKGITPEVIGASIYRTKDFDLKLNFIEEKETKNQELINVLGFNVTAEQLFVYTALVGLVFVLIGFAGSKAIGGYVAGLEAQNNELTTQQTTLEADLNKLQKEGNKIDIYTIAGKIEKGMVEKMLYYTAIGSDIPKKVWLTSFYADSRKAYNIEGGTTSVDDVYLFFRNIKSQVPNSNLILSKLSVDDEGGLIDISVNKNANYSFALSNHQYKNASIPAPATEDSETAKESMHSEKASISKVDVPQLPVLPSI